MEDTTSPDLAEATRADEFAQAFGRRRDELEAFLAAGRERFSAAETKLTGQIRHLAESLAQAQSEIRRTRDQQAARDEQLAREAQRLAELKESLEAAQAQWREAQDRTAKQQRQLADQIETSQATLAQRFDELAEREARIAEAESQVRNDQEQLALAQRQLNERDRELAASRESLDKELHELETQRKELERQRKQWASRHGKDDEIANARLAELESRLNAATGREEALQHDLTAARQTCTQLETKLAEQSTNQTDQQAEAHRQLESERDALAARLDESENRVAEHERQLKETQEANDQREDYRDRYKTAVEEIKTIGQRNKSLEKQLADANRGAAAAGFAPPGDDDWESRKRQLLAALEDIDEDDENENARRIEVENVIKTTEVAIAAKDQEIVQLRQRLDQQGERREAPAGGAPEFDQALDQDAVIHEERERLQRLQNELEEKLRQAEIDLSIERADVARQRLEVEEIMRQFAEQVTPAETIPASTSASDAAGDEKPAGRRWLARLGLKKQDG